MKIFEKITYLYSLILANLMTIIFRGYIQKLEINKKGFQEFEIREYFSHNTLYSSKQGSRK